ncbi:MAG: cell cycle transcriptional regulator TrcR [Sphingomonadales bacterium]
MQQPLMPKATAVWLVDNTTLGFDQIADFCGLHPLEVQGIADGEVAMNIVGLDPVAKGQLSREEIERCEADPSARLKIREEKVPARQRSKGPRYTPLSKRQDRPDAIAWFVKFHPEVSDAQISKLVGTTKQTISAIRDKTHWNISAITPRDPVMVGLCKQWELDEVIEKAAARVRAAAGPVAEPAPAEPAPEPAPDTAREENEPPEGMTAPASDQGEPEQPDSEQTDSGQAEVEPKHDV